jgi:hypothetical protein
LKLTKKYMEVTTMVKKRKHKVGSSWTAMRKVGKHRKRVRIKKVGKSRYRVHVLGGKRRKRKPIRHTKRGMRMDRRRKSQEPWEIAYRKHKRRHRRRR